MAKKEWGFLFYGPSPSHNRQLIIRAREGDERISILILASLKKDPAAVFAAFFLAGIISFDDFCIEVDGRINIGPVPMMTHRIPAEDIVEMKTVEGRLDSLSVFIIHYPSRGVK